MSTGRRELYLHLGKISGFLATLLVPLAICLADASCTESGSRGRSQRFARNGILVTFGRDRLRRRGRRLSYRRTAQRKKGTGGQKRQNVNTQRTLLRHFHSPTWPGTDL